MFNPNGSEQEGPAEEAMAAYLWTDVLLIDIPAGGRLNGASWESSPQIVRTLLSCETKKKQKKKKKNETKVGVNGRW